MWCQEAHKRWVTGVSSGTPPTRRSEVYQEGNPFLLALRLSWLSGSLVPAQNCYKGLEFHHPFYLLSPFVVLFELERLASDGCCVVGEAAQSREARGPGAPRTEGAWGSRAGWAVRWASLPLVSASERIESRSLSTLIHFSFWHFCMSPFTEHLCY